MNDCDGLAHAVLTRIDEITDGYVEQGQVSGVVVPWPGVDGSMSRRRTSWRSAGRR